MLSTATDVEGYVSSESVAVLADEEALAQIEAIQMAKSNAQTPEQTNTQPPAVTVPAYMAPRGDAVEIRQMCLAEWIMRWILRAMSGLW